MLQEALRTEGARVLEQLRRVLHADDRRRDRRPRGKPVAAERKLAGELALYRVDHRARAERLADDGVEVSLAVLACQLMPQVRKDVWMTHEPLQAPRERRRAGLIAGHQEREQL